MGRGRVLVIITHHHQSTVDATPTTTQRPAGKETSWRLFAAVTGKTYNQKQVFNDYPNLDKPEPKRRNTEGHRDDPEIHRVLRMNRPDFLSVNLCASSVNLCVTSFLLTVQEINSSGTNKRVAILFIPTQKSLSRSRDLHLQAPKSPRLKHPEYARSVLMLLLFL